MWLASAASAAALAQSAQPTNELFTGISLSGNDTSAYLGGGTSFGKGLWTPGWRARAVGSLGRYDYAGSLQEGRNWYRRQFDGEDSFLAALAGYQFQKGKTTLKLFAGIETINQDVSPFDPRNPVQGSATGVLLEAESWIDLSVRSYISFDASYGSAFDDYWSLARFGFKLRPRLSVGVEGGALGNRAYDAGRGGAFIRIDLRRVQVTLSSGVTGDYLQSQSGAYFSLDVYRTF